MLKEILDENWLELPSISDQPKDISAIVSEYCGRLITGIFYFSTLFFVIHFEKRELSIDIDRQLRKVGAYPTS